MADDALVLDGMDILNYACTDSGSRYLKAMTSKTKLALKVISTPILQNLKMSM